MYTKKIQLKISSFLAVKRPNQPTTLNSSFSVLRGPFGTPQFVVVDPHQKSGSNVHKSINLPRTTNNPSNQLFSGRDWCCNCSRCCCCACDWCCSCSRCCGISSRTFQLHVSVSVLVALKQTNIHNLMMVDLLRNLFRTFAH